MNLRAARRVSGIERTLIRRITDGAPPDAINLGLGQPDLPTPPAVALAGVEAIVSGRTGYTSTAGDPELRAAVASRYGLGPDRDVMITVGSQEALYLGCLVLVDPGREVLYADPGYPAHPEAARLVGAHPVPYPLRPERGFRLHAADVEARVNERTALVVLSAPSNPTGACHPPEELERLVCFLEERGVPWLSDEVYGGFTYGAASPSPGDVAPTGGLVVSGLSKEMSMTGWRIGWLAGPTEILRRAIAAHQYLVTCASSVSQRAGLAAFSPAGREQRDALIERFRKRRALMGDELARIRGLRFEPPDGAFYFFVDVSRYGSSMELARRVLERQRVITIPGEAFGTRGAGYLRLSFAASEEAIRNGVRRLGNELLG